MNSARRFPLNLRAIAVRVFGPLVAVVLSSGFALLFAEMVLRSVDGYRLGTVELRRTAPALPSVIPAPDTLEVARSLTRREGVNVEWFADDPPVLPFTPAEERFAPFVKAAYDGWLRRMSVIHFWAEDAEMLRGQNMGRVWNREYARSLLCEGNPFYRGFDPGILVFPSVGEGRRPSFRFIPHGHIGRMRVNRLGMRGAEISAAKPARTVRIAFLGASTTVNQPEHAWSYPEFVVHWLNLWARSNGFDVTFEGINAARPGYSSPDIAAVFRSEVMPLAPDLVVYYEGANQFDFRPLLQLAVGQDGLVPPAEPALQRGLRDAAQYSALARRLLYFWLAESSADGTEPEKPDYTLTLPEDAEWTHPNPDSDTLPLGLSQIVQDVDGIRAAAQIGGASLVVSSFVWLGEGGMRIDPIRNAGIDFYLNRRFWPLKYGDLRQLADYQNRVLQAYARDRGVGFLEVAARMPMKPDLFVDGIHMTQDGVRLRAWIAFQELLDTVRAQLDSGTWPRAVAGTGAALVADPASIRIVPSRCMPEIPVRDSGVSLPLHELDAATPDAAVLALPNGVSVTTPPGRFDYAARMPVAEIVRFTGPVWLDIRVREASGPIAFGVLNRETGAWLAQTVYHGDEGAVLLKIDNAELAGEFLITNAATNDGAPASVSLSAVTILVPDGNTADVPGTFNEGDH